MMHYATILIFKSAISSAGAYSQDFEVEEAETAHAKSMPKPFSLATLTLLT